MKNSWPHSVLSDTVVLFLFPFFRKQYKKILDCVVIIQKNYRAFFLRRRFLHLKKAAVVFQKQLRGQIARRVYRQLLAEKRAEEEKRKREEEERYGLSLFAWNRQDTFGVFMLWIQPWGCNSQSMLLETVPFGGSDKIPWHHWRPSFMHIFIHAKNSCLYCPRKTPRSSFTPFKSSLAKLLLTSSLLAPSNGRCHSCSR